MKRKSFFELTVLFVLGIGVLFSLLAYDNPALQRESKLLEISVIIREADSTNWFASRQGMEQAALEQGVELRFLTLDSENNVEEQCALLAREAEGGADGIVLVPADPTIMAGEVKKASEKTVVVTMESDMSSSGAKTCISVDNAALGKALGAVALNGVPVGDCIVLLNSAPGSTGVSTRLSDAAAVLEAEGRSVRICTPSGEERLTDALATVLTTVHPTAVLAFEPSALEQAAQVIQNADSQPLLYGMGVTASIASYLERGVITSIAAQNEFAAGYMAVENTVSAIRHGSVRSVTPLTVKLVRQETMYDADNQKLLFPVAR